MMYDDLIDKFINEVCKELESHDNNYDDCDWDCESCESYDECSEADGDEAPGDDDIECDSDCENCESNEDNTINKIEQDNTGHIDSVNHPSHYCDGNIEVIDYIEDKRLGYHLGNAVKYISRAGKKHEDGKSDIDKEIEDLKKAVWYIERYIEKLQIKKLAEEMLAPFGHYFKFKYDE